MILPCIRIIVGEAGANLEQIENILTHWSVAHVGWNVKKQDVLNLVGLSL